MSLYKGDHTLGEIEIESTDLIFENKYLQILNDHVIFPSNYHGTYVRINTPTNRGVAVLPITSEGKIVLIKTFRHGMRSWGYEIPKGGVEAGENSEEAARRELMEETGYSAGHLRYVGEYGDSPAIISNTMKCYIALDCKSENALSTEKTEAISQVCEFDADEFLLKSDQMGYKDSITELLVYRFMFNK